MCAHAQTPLGPEMIKISIKIQDKISHTINMI